MWGSIKAKLKRAENIILLIYTPLYVAFILIAFIQGEFDQMTGEIAGLLVVFFLFLLILLFYFCKNGLVSGILFLVWVTVVVYVDLNYVVEDVGMGIISSIPILSVGLLLLKRALKKPERDL
jgi:ABC-type transport system involved in cytochrome c biogenesis permease subunit